MRAYNERLIMDALLKAGALSKAELAREIGLSGQAASVIVNRLLADGYLVKLDKIRGQVGQPSTPIAPNPDGAFSLGVKIGRRSSEAILVNLLGEVIGSDRERYEAPFPEQTLPRAIAQANALLARLPQRKRNRVVGLGIAMPSEIHVWAKELGLAPGALDGWKEADVAAALESATGLEATLHNDATAACAAEMLAGTAITRRSALYIYLGTFIGGGVVVDGRLYSGEQLNAGAIGSMPVCGGSGTEPRQLIHIASVITLERALVEAGQGRSVTLTGSSDPKAIAVFEAWLGEAAPAIAQSAVAALGVIDFQMVIVDGILPAPWRARVTEQLQVEISRFNLAGLRPAEVAAGTIGPSARVLGAAMLPLRARFSPDPDLLARLRPGEAEEAA
ncbi:ROK family transcriptional regulator [Afifella sp. IM 167]|uniref:ROK family transcriptional regulator n=1 Tax=Afifella sp. IM 167 TaxID=2033586 RepID=UPI001CCC9C59|nr:ROK family transcriptional regulator [Afifella sp. IM 167]